VTFLKFVLAPFWLTFKAVQLIGSGINWLANTVIKGLAKALSPVTWSVRGIGSMFAGIGSGIMATIRMITGALMIPVRIIQGLISILGSGISFIGNSLAGFGTMITSVLMTPFNLIRGAIGLVQSAIGGLVSAVAGAMQFLWGMIPSPIKWALSQAANGVAWIVSALMPSKDDGNLEAVKMATGGLVKGSGSATSDNIPALLSPGEFVMPAGVTAGNLATLEGMRQGAIAEPPSAQPMATPAIVMPSPSAFTVGSSEPRSSAPITVEVALNVGGITIGASGQPTNDVRNELLGMLSSPEFQIACQEAMREAVEKMR
jgi:hypothetical protein